MLLEEEVALVAFLSKHLILYQIHHHNLTGFFESGVLQINLIEENHELDSSYKYTRIDSFKITSIFVQSMTKDLS